MLKKDYTNDFLEYQKFKEFIKDEEKYNVEDMDNVDVTIDYNGKFKEEVDDENESDYLDEELDDYNLEEWQKDLVKKGEYDPWDFEEEDLEEDDYYEEE